MAPPTAPLLFVSVAAYNDPELLPTLHDAYAKAAHPEQLRFGVVDQYVEDRYEEFPPVERADPLHLARAMNWALAFPDRSSRG